MRYNRIAKQFINEVLEDRANSLVDRLKTKLNNEQTDDSIINDELHGRQKDLDMNKNGKLDKDDFRRLRNRKHKGKRRNINDQLKGRQHKIDLNRNNKLDREDFEMLRNRRKKSKKSSLFSGIILLTLSQVSISSLDIFFAIKIKKFHREIYGINIRKKYLN